MKISNKNPSVEVEGATFTFRPRNVETSKIIAEASKMNDNDIGDLLRGVLVGWSDVVDEDGNEVVFHEATINKLDIKSAAAILDAIMEVYGFESTLEKN